mmetsp:Transcript_12420/g.16014  ORF Transcript_12420/g.16014 Transcript_12420/m.16014 type:complete len:277 (+) Transcript_12420:141-971(+)
MWVLATSGKVLLNQVEVRVFVTAFDPKGTDYGPIKSRTIKDENDLLTEIHTLPLNKAQRKISDLLSHLENLRVYMRVISELRNEYKKEWWWQREERKNFLLQDLGSFLDKVCRVYDLPVGNLPDKDNLKALLTDLDWSKLPSLSNNQLSKVTFLTDKVLPDMLNRLEDPERHDSNKKTGGWGNTFQSISRASSKNKTPLMLAMGIILMGIICAAIIIHFQMTISDIHKFVNSQLKTCQEVTAEVPKHFVEFVETVQDKVISNSNSLYSAVTGKPEL